MVLANRNSFALRRDVPPIAVWGSRRETDHKMQGGSKSQKETTQSKEEARLPAVVSSELNRSNSGPRARTNLTKIFSPH
eukprot:1440497-Amphidinium_carterae.1